MKTAVLSLALALLSAPPGARAGVQDGALTPEWVQRFEQSFDLNEALENDSAYRGRLSLDSYARYYEIGVSDGVTLVTAVYVPPIERHREGEMACWYGDGEPTKCRPVAQPSAEVLRRRGRGVHIGEPFPMFFDGGCSVVTLRIEPETLVVVSARCNGVA